MNKVYKLFFYSIPVLFLFISSSCTKIDTTSLGQDLIPPIDGVNTMVTDTFNITTENFLFNDSTRLNKTDAYLLGQLVTDPIFGRTDATIYAELKPTFQFRWRALKDSIINLPNGGYDSSFVNLAFQPAGTEKGIYGDSNSTISVRVWGITDNSNFKVDSNYAITVNPNIPHGTLLGTASFRPADLKNQQIAVLKRDTVRDTHFLRIKLNATGDAIMRDLLSKDTNNVFNNDANFRNYFKGFVIEPFGGGGNAIVKFDLPNPKTRLEIWYRFISNGVVDTTFDSFGFMPTYGHPFQAASANYIQRSTAGAPFLNYLAAGADSVIVLQSTPGTYATIRIPSMKSFPNKIIHRAELVMDEDPNFAHPFYTPPLNLYLDCYDTGAIAGTRFRTVPFDFYFTNFLTGQVDFNYFGGQRTNAPDGPTRARYTFNVTKYLQGMISRNDQYYDFRLYCPFDTRYHNQYVANFPWPVISSPTFGRVVLGGGSSTRYRMKLRVIYSNI